jgi:hypothetical protein
MATSRWCWILVAAACGTSSAPPKPAPSSSSTTAAPSTGDAALNAPSITRSADGHCEPMPREGTPCRAGDGWCVISWGTPGGRSSALWCRDRRWVLEEEANLPEK